MIQYNERKFTGKDKEKLILTTPIWDNLNLSSVLPELTALIFEEDEIREKIGATKPKTYKELHTPFSEIGERMRRLWGPVSHLNSVMQTKELQAVIEEGEQIISEASSRILMNKGLYDAYLSYRNESEEYQTLTPERKKVIDDRIEDAELAGVALSEDKKKRMTEIRKNLAELGTQIEANVKSTVASWNKHITDEALLAGVPLSTKDAMEREAKVRGLSGWLLTLHAPIYGPVIANASDRELRKELYTAFVTRASDKGPYDGKCDNMPLIKEILSLRYEESKLLGYPNFATLALKKRMAPSVPRVREFLEGLAQKANTKAKIEYAELSDFAKNRLHIEQIEAWDVAYVSEKLQKATYDLSEEDLRPYFSEARVLSGVFDLVRHLYGGEVKELSGVSSWKNGVKFFALYDKDRELRGGFYADLFARNGKNQGAWMDVLMDRRVKGDGIQLPVAYLNTNFTQPKEGEEALLTHREVETIFHEFGHVLHHLFGRTDEPEISMLGVEWDAVECPSQVNENWAWEKKILSSLSHHYQTGEELPEKLMDKLIASKNYLTALMLLRQIEFSLIDLKLHTEVVVDPNIALTEVRKKIRITPTIPDDRFLASFTHIFSGGYAAGYYSYLWAEVLSADLFEAFSETGDVFNKEVGARFLSTVLEAGSSRPFMESYVAFRKREPSSDALLRLRGL